jgi:hypothetical protein
MTAIQRVLLLVVVFLLSALLLGNLSGILPNPALTGLILVGALAVATSRVPRFWWTVLYSAMSGLAAGLIILGPGMRLVMRIVAIVDPGKNPEFTVGGTMFLIIFIGGIFGAGIAVVTGLVVRALNINGRVIPSLMMASLLMVMLLANAGLRMELFDFGLGAWMNIPMFATVGLGFGLGATAARQRLEKRRSDVGDTLPVEVPA